MVNGSAEIGVRGSSWSSVFIVGAGALVMRPPHDYGVTVVLLTFADRVVPADQLLAELRRRKIEACDLSANEMAKLHVRYMVGGRAPGLDDEQLFRFEFPERPGACLAFLDAIGSRFNISLFHYRNHGAAYGRVLAGLQVPKGKSRECREALDALGYPYWDERDNPAYALFLGAATKP